MHLIAIALLLQAAPLEPIQKVEIGKNRRVVAEEGKFTEEFGLLAVHPYRFGK